MGRMVRGDRPAHTVRARGGRPPGRTVGRTSRPGGEPPYTDPMRTSYTLGRVAGIEIGINWSVLALLALIMWTLATGVFPDTNPGLSDNAYFAMAVVAAFGFFASILLHELGHAVQARRDGMEIDGITLWLFGGVARFTGMFPTAGAEFRIAIAGPLVSLLLAAGLLGGTWLPGLPEPVDGVLAWLGIINAALLIFNLIPALPLDGGRMLRAALWQWKGDLQSATRLAAGIGRVLAIGMIVLGPGDGRAGRRDQRRVARPDRLVRAAGRRRRGADGASACPPPVGPRVGDMMDADPVTTRPELTLDEFSRLAGIDLDHDAYAVLGDDGRPVGHHPHERPGQGAAGGLAHADGGRVHGRPHGRPRPDRRGVAGRRDGGAAPLPGAAGAGGGRRAPGGPALPRRRRPHARAARRRAHPLR